MHAATYGLDVAKRVFQMYWVDGDTGEIVNRCFGRDALIQYFSRRTPGRVALEACGSAHWGDRRQELADRLWLEQQSLPRSTYKAAPVRPPTRSKPG